MLAHKKLWNAAVYDEHNKDCTSKFADWYITTDIEFGLMSEHIEDTKTTKENAAMYCCFFALYFADEMIINSEYQKTKSTTDFIEV